MGLTIVFKQPPGREWFTSFDILYGTIVWCPKGPVLASQIAVHLEGILKISLDAGHEPTCGNQTQVLLSRQAVLLNSNQRFAAGTHTFPFQLQFPLFSSGYSRQRQATTQCETSLPPSFQLVSNSLTASMMYRLRAVVRRPGLLSRNISGKHELEFRPLHPPTMSSSEREGPFKVTSRFSGVSLGLIESHLADQSGLPTYSPAISFDLTVPRLETIRPGAHPNLRMSVRVPYEVQQALGTLWLSRITLQLKAITTARVGPCIQTCVGQIEICSTKGFLPLNSAPGNEEFTIPSELWQSHVYPVLVPSFESRDIKRDHRLEVIAEFTSLISKHSLTIGVDVIVQSGFIAASETPPEYVLASSSQVCDA